MKPIATSALALLIAAPIGTAVEAQVRLDFWTEFADPLNRNAIEAVVDSFNAEHPDIEVVHTGFENTPYETTLKTSFAGGNPADIVEINGGSNMYQYAEAGGLIDLTDWAEGLGDAYMPVEGIETIGRFDGRLYGIPLLLNPGNLLWYNASMLEEQGIDPAQLNTWAGFLDAARTFRDAGVAPIAFGNAEGWPGNHIFNHLTRRLLTEQQYVDIANRTYYASVDSDMKWTDEAAVRAWELYAQLDEEDLFTAGPLSDNFPTAANIFISGEAPFMTMGSWLLPMIEETNPDLDFGVIGFPEVEGAPGAQTDMVTSGLVVTVTSASDHPEEAKKFLEFLMREDVQEEYLTTLNSFTPYQYDTSDWGYGESFSRLTAIVNNSTSAAPFLDMIEDQECNVPWVWQASQGILSGALDPQQAAMGHERCVEDLRDDKGLE